MNAPDKVKFACPCAVDANWEQIEDKTDIPYQNSAARGDSPARRGIPRSRTTCDLQDALVRGLMAFVGAKGRGTPGFRRIDLQQGERIDTCAFKMCLLEDKVLL